MRTRLPGVSRRHAAGALHGSFVSTPVSCARFRTAAGTGLAGRSPRLFAVDCNTVRVAHRYAGLSAVSLPYQCRGDESAVRRSGAGDVRLLGFDVPAGRSNGLAIILVQSVTGWFWWRYVLRNPGSRRVARALTLTLLGAVVTFHAVHIWADATADIAADRANRCPAAGVCSHCQALIAESGSRCPSASLSRALARKQEHGGLVYPLYPMHASRARRPTSSSSHRLVARRCAERASHAEPRSIRAQRRALPDHHSGGNATRIGVFSLFYSIPGTYWHRMLAVRQGPVFITQLLDVTTTCARFAARRCSVRSSIAPCSRTSRACACVRTATTPRARSRSHERFLSFLAHARQETPFFALLFYDSSQKLDVSAR